MRSLWPQARRQGARDKRAKEFEMVYAECFRGVYGYIASRVQDSQTAEDLTQDVFLGAVKGIGRFDSEFTLDQFLNNGHEFAPDVDKLTLDSPSPLQAGADGKYSVPMPGLVKKREYL